MKFTWKSIRKRVDLRAKKILWWFRSKDIRHFFKWLVSEAVFAAFPQIVKVTVLYVKGQEISESELWGDVEIFFFTLILTSSTLVHLWDKHDGKDETSAHLTIRLVLLGILVIFLSFSAILIGLASFVGHSTNELALIGKPLVIMTVLFCLTINLNYSKIEA